MTAESDAMHSALVQRADAIEFRLAPLYDLASWLPYSRNRREDRFAMSVDGYYHFDRILPRHWEAEARKSRYDGAHALGHIRDIVARLPDEARTLLAICQQDGSATDDLTKLVGLLLNRCVELAKTYGAEPMGSKQTRLPGI
jgi:hypothetical protein